MKKTTQLLISLTCLALCGASVQAANKYWDINGATPGAGGATPGGTWSTGAANWSTDSTGSAATAAWVSGTTDTAIFSAGTDANGEFTVNLPSATTAGALTVEEGIVDLTGAALTVRNITIGNGSTLSYVSSGAIVAGGSGTTTNMTINGGTFRCMNAGVGGTFHPAGMEIILGTGGGTLSVDGAAAAISIYAGLIKGTGPLTKAGVGTFRLTTRVATYTGPTIIAGGTLQISTTANVLPSATDVTINSGAILNVQNTLRIGSVTGDGSITMTAVTLTIGGSTSPADFTGVISDGTVFGNITKTGTGTLTLSGANSYDGTFTLSQGTCTVTASGLLCGPACDVAINGGVLNLNNADQTIENFNGSASTVNLGTGHTLNSVPAGSATYAGTIAGNGAFTYTGGAYTQTLSGTNSYSGGTTLNSGTLILSGANTGNGAIAVNGGTLVLSGTNTGNGAITVSGGKLLGYPGGACSNSVVTVSPGAANAVLVTDASKPWTCGGLIYNAGANLDFDFGHVFGGSIVTVPSTSVAPIRVNGNVDFTAGVPTVTIEAFALPVGAGSYPLITWSGSLLGAPPTTVANLPAQTTATLSVTGNTLYLNVTANLEPLTWATGSDAWDIDNLANWKNGAGTVSKYLETTLPGDLVVFEDTLSGTSPITVTLNGLVTPTDVAVNNSTKAYTLSGFGSIGGTTRLTKNGSGVFTITTANSYTGPTIVNAGTLQLGDATANGDVQSVITNNASLVFSNALDLTHASDIRGTGPMTKGSAGTLALGASGGNNMSGGQNVYDGTLLLPNTANEMAGPILVNGPTAKLEIASSGCIGSTVAGSGDITLNNGAIFQNDNIAVGNTWLTANRKIIIGANGGRFATAVGSDPGNVVLLCTGTIAGSPVGVGTLTFDGPGELRYSGTSAHNTFGKLILNGGRFCVGQATTAGFDDTYGAVPAVLTADAITVQNGGQMRWGGSATGTLSANRGITIGSGGGVISVVPPAQLTIPGPITGSGALRLHLIFATSSENGFLVLSGANTFSGGVTIATGTNCINSTTALGAAASTVTIGANSLYAPQLRNTSAGAITLVNNNPQIWQTDFSFQGTQNLNLGTGAVTLSPLSGSTITLTGTANILTVGGVISGAGIGLTKAGAGTLQLNAINAYGDTTISAGTLQLGDGTANNGNVAGNIIDTGTLVFANPTALAYSAGVISGTGALTKQGAGTLTLSGGPETYSGATTVSAGTLQLGSDDILPDTSPVVLGANTVTLDMNHHKDTIGALSGAGSVINNDSTLTLAADANTGTLFQNYSCIYGPFTNGNLAKSGTHTLALRETNTFTVPVTLNAGTLSVGVISNEMPATTAMNIPAGATFQLDGTYQTVSALTGAGNVNLGGTLTVNQADTTSSSFTGLIQDSGVAGSSTAVGHGLRGYYYDNADFTSLLAVRDDATINFTNLALASQLPAAIFASSTNNDSIRWIGKILSTAAGTYTFTTTCDDGRRLWINGQLVIDSWVPGATTKTGTIDLAANTKYDILMEWYNGTGGATANLLWTPPGDSTATIIATDYLFLPSPGQLIKNGLGTLTLSTGANTYSGGTVVNAGILDAQVPLGAGSVTVASGATLKVSAANAIASTGDLILSGASPVVQLALSGGTDTIHGLSFDGGATWQAVGQYGPPLSGATHEDARFQGSGFVSVGAGPVAGQTLASSLNPANYGSSVTFTSTVTGSGATPTGTVTFYDGPSALGTATLNGSGVATFSVSRLSVAGSAHSITGVYNGDSNYTRSTSSALSQVINPATLVPSVTVTNRVYDGTSIGTIVSRSVAGVISGDEPYVSLVGGTATFLDRNIGTGKTVNVTGLSLAGSLSGDYVLSTTSASTTANITNRLITVTAATNTKPYDGNTTSTGVPTITTGSLATPDTATWTETFDSPNVGTRVLTPAGTVNDGNGGANYLVTFATASGSITAQCSAINALLGITPNTNSTFTLSFQGSFGAQYYVQSATSVTAPITWAPIVGSTNTVTNVSGLWTFNVTNTVPTRFYRSAAMSVCP